LYPSLSGTMAPLSAKVRQAGLKLGLWYMAGVPTASIAANSPIKGTNFTVRDIITNTTYCPRWDPGWGSEVDHSHPAASAWYESLVELWASWGVELIKLDCVNAEDELTAHRQDIIAISSAMERQESDFLFSLSPGGSSNISQLLDIRDYISMARVTDDFWDSWSFMTPHWDVARDLVAARRSTPPSFWIDLDMLPLGRIGHPGAKCTPSGPGCPRHTRFTPDEQRSVLSLWAMAQSPLILGADLADLDQDTATLISNHQVLQMTEDLIDSAEAFRTNSTSESFIVWRGVDRQDSLYLGVFNQFNATQAVSFAWRDAGVPEGAHAMQDMWTGKMDNMNKFQASIGAHGVSLVKLISQQ